MPQQSWILITCATLLGASDPQNIPNRNGLKQAWLQAMYSIEPNDLTAQNKAQNLKLSFGSSETRLVHGDASLALRLVGFGRGGQLRSLDAALISSSKNRVEYRRGVLTEWYVNEPAGLEQGFTLSAPPSFGNGPLEIALDITGNLRPKPQSSSELTLLDSRGHAVLRYGDLKAWDAKGQSLASRLVVDGDRVVRLIIEDAHALYPVTIDPTLTQIVLLPSDGASSVHFGQSLSISGNVALVGAPSEGGNTGAAYVFVFSGGAWGQQAKLTASDGVSGDQFGSSVSVDGATAIIGASGANAAQGAAYVFLQSGSNWNPQAKLTASDGAAGDQFGISVAVSGASAVVGASGSASSQGATYVFAETGSAWSQQAKLTAADAAAGDLFGASVSLSGTTAVAGAAGKFGSTGAAYVFISSGTSWSQQAKLTAADGVSGDRFAFSVSISGDTVLAGAPAKTCQFSCGTSSAGGLGGAYVFVRTGISWSQQAALVSSDGGGAFGYSVAVSGTTAIVLENYNNSFLTGAAFAFVRAGTNWPQQAKLAASDLVGGDGLATAAVSGSVALIGAPTKTGGQGAVYAFAQTGTNWTQQAKLIPSDVSSADGFGSAISVNGETALIASPLKASKQGAVYVFVRSATDGTWSQQAKLTASGSASFGQSVSLSGDTAVIGASNTAYVFLRSGTSWTQQATLAGSDTAAGDNFGSPVTVDGDTAVVSAASKNATGAAYVFVRSGTTWTQQAKLTASDAVPNDSFGNSVSLSGDAVLLGARGKNSLQGAAYVFVRSGAAWTQQAELAPSEGVNDNFGTSVSLSGGTAIVGAYFENSAEGVAYVFVQSGTNWSQQAKLQPSDGIAGIIFGTSVSIDGDLAVVSAYKGGGGAGAAYVFARSGANWTQTMKLTAADGVTGDEFGNAVSISDGTVIAGAPDRAGGEGAAFVFPLPTVSAGGLVNAASFSHTVAPGSIASVFGTNYGNSNIGASVKPLPESLGNVSITVNNVAAPLIFVGQFQANFQIPFETTPGTATVVVTSNGIASPAATVNVTAEAPGIFVTGTNQAVALNADNTVADSTHPAKVGSVVVMYVTGLGALDHPLRTGAPASNDPLSNATVVPTATVGGVSAVVQFAGMSPGFVGLGQINLMIPKLAKGSYPVVIKQGAQTSNNPVISVTP